MNNPHTRVPKKRSVPLRYFLALVIFIALLPPLLLLSFSLVRSADNDRAAAEQRFVDNAQLLASMVESTFTANAAMIKTLATQLHEEDLAPLARHFFGSIEYLPPADFAGGPSTRKWYISNLYDIEPGVGATARLTIPLSDNEDSITLVSDALALTRNIDLSSSENSTMLVAVVDGNGRIVARSTQQDTFIGRQVPTWQQLLDMGTDQGIFPAETLEGDEVVFGFSKIHGTPGWAVVTGIPKAIFESRTRASNITLIAGAALTVVLTTLLATWLATLIINPVTALVLRARAILENQPLDDATLSPSAITEIAELQSAQQLAQQALQHRANELALSEQRYRAIAKAGALGTWHRHSDGPLLGLEGWEEFTGQSSEQAKQNQWRDRIHPDDLPAFDAQWEAGRFQPVVMDMEFRVLNRDDTYIWLRSRGAPILDGEGKVVEWVGTLENIDEHKRQHLHVSHLAYHDALTGLANRMRLDEHLNSAWNERNQGIIGALIYIDLDRFKQANDTFGHAVGDEVLRKVAGRLERLTRPTDIVARLGGDEFAIVLHNVGETDISTMLGMRIVRSLSNPFEIDGQIIEIGASVGIANIDQSATDIAQVVWRADAALYRAKSAGKNRSMTFTEDDDTQPMRS